MVYYNYRYYNTRDGRWMGRDKWLETDSYNLYLAMMNNPVNKIDLQGNNVVIIAGGIDYQPEKQRHHDANQFNFRMAAAQKVLELMEEAPNEIYEILVETETYKLRNEGPPAGWWDAFRWHQKREYYSAVFYRKTNVIVRYINNEHELCEALSKTHTGKQRTGSTLISSFYYFGHGAVGKLGIQYPFNPSMLTWYIDISDIPRIFKKEYFSKNPFVDLQTCHSASTSKVENINKSFAEVLSAHLEGELYGINGRLDYTPVGSLGLSGTPGKPEPGTSFSEIADTKKGENPSVRHYINGKLVK